VNDGDYSNPAASELEKYLGSLREDSPRPGSELVPHVLRRARWQQAIRTPLRAVAELVGALADGLEALVGSGRGRR
jgi:hypothetical protein